MARILVAFGAMGAQSEQLGQREAGRIPDCRLQRGVREINFLILRPPRSHDRHRTMNGVRVPPYYSTYLILVTCLNI